jgi:c-di-GMP-binding flagellar brake protein YcgR
MISTNNNYPTNRRKEIRIPLIVSIKEQTQTGVSLSLSEDISLTGMALKRASNTIKHKEDRLILEFVLPGINELVKVPSRFLRGKKESKLQKGVVIFEEIPEILLNWFKLYFEDKISDPLIT